MSPVESRRDRWSRIGVTSWAVVGMIVLFAVALWLLARLEAVLTPLALALVIVFFLKAPVNWLCSRGVPRTAAVLLAYVLGIGVLVGFSIFILPTIASRFGQFFEQFPVYYDRVYQLWVDIQDRYRALAVPSWLEAAITDAQDEVVTQGTALSRRLASGVFAAGGQAVNFFFNIIMSAVISFYLLKDLPKIREGALALLPESRRPEARHLYSTVVGAIGGFIRGQIIVAAFVGVLAYIVLALIGVPFPLVIGLITGVFNVIPYFGAIVGAVTAAVAAAFVDPWLALWAVLALVAVQQVESLVISPRVMSQAVDLHPVAVILSLLAGGTLLGFTGLLIAIPIAAAAKGVSVYYLEKHGMWQPAPRYSTRLWIPHSPDSPTTPSEATSPANDTEEME